MFLNYYRGLQCIVDIFYYILLEGMFLPIYFPERILVLLNPCPWHTCSAIETKLINVIYENGRKNVNYCNKKFEKRHVVAYISLPRFY